MSQSSKRAQATQFSPIRMLEPLADQARQRGVKIYHLNIGQPDIPTPEVFLNGMRTIPPVLAYSPSQGLDEARQALAGYYEDRDINISPDQMVITTGGSEAIIFSLLAVADPGDAILIPEPYYANYNAYATMAGVRIIPIESRSDSGFHLPERAAIERLITPRTRAILICNPGNPTGTVYRPEELELLAELARQHDLFLISDEVYREFVYDGLSHTSVLQLANLEQQAILVDSISKRFSACGARIGALLSRNPDIMQSVLKFAQARLSPPTLGQLGLIALLRRDCRGCRSRWPASVADPGDAILIPEPYYANYNAYATMAGVRIIPIESRSDSGFHLPERAAIERLITPRTRAILICNPGNPTGTVYRPEELELLAELARQHDLFLISDEVYREFVYDGLSHTSVLQLANLEQQAILVDSISKRFSACGARIGALLSRNPDIMQSVLKFAQARLSPPTLGQLGLIALLRRGDYRSQVEQMIEKFGRRRDRLYAELQRIPGVRCAKPQGAFYVIAGLPVDSAELFCRWLLAKFELDGETVMLAPAAAFYHTPGKGQDEVRLAYVLDEEALGRALQIVRAGLAAYPGRSLSAGF